MVQTPEERRKAKSAYTKRWREANREAYLEQSRAYRERRKAQIDKALNEGEQK